jgi:hypothetical protein
MSSTPIQMDPADTQIVQSQVNNLAAEMQDLLESNQPSLFGGKISDLVVSGVILITENGSWAETIMVQNEIFLQAQGAGDRGGRIIIPRRVISAGMAINEGLQKGTEVQWGTVSVDDPRIINNAWYVAGRITPPLGKFKLLK